MIKNVPESDQHRLSEDAGLPRSEDKGRGSQDRSGWGAGHAASRRPGGGGGSRAAPALPGGGLAAVGLAGSEDDKHGTQRVSGTRRPRGLCESLSAAPPGSAPPRPGPPRPYGSRLRLR